MRRRRFPQRRRVKPGRIRFLDSAIKKAYNGKGGKK